MIRNLFFLISLSAFAYGNDFSSEYHLVRASRSLGNEKIVGGEEVAPNSLPFQVSVQRSSNNFHFCGGSVLDETTVITAAHCCRGQEAHYVQVVAGAHDLTKVSGDEQLRMISKITYHEDFATHGINNDICLLELENPFELNEKVKGVTLPKENETFEGEVVVSGWGTLYSNGPTPSTLRAVEVKIRSFLFCNLVYLGQLDDSMVCASAAGKDSCQGDSGGPLSQGNKLVGIVSFGIGCANPIFPGVYAKTSKFVDWIQKNK